MEKKVMSDYTLFCTEEQTKKALELGASIDFFEENDEHNEHAVHVGQGLYAVIPTAEQMIGWLEEELELSFLTGIDDEDKFFFNVFHPEGYLEVRGCNSRKEATLAAIDAALEYLSNNKKL